MRTNSEPVTPTTASLTPLSIALGALAAGLGSLAVVALGTAPPIWLAAGVGGGALVAASVGPRAVGAGRGLMWGIAVALLGWLVVPLLGAVPLAPVVQPLGLPNLGVSPAAQLALLPRGVLGIGVPAGAVVGWWHGRRSTRPELNLARALATGGIAGILGGAAFGVWLGQAGVFPRIAGIIGVDSVLVGQLVHFGIASTIGVSFAILFQRDVQGYGSALGWGVAYGLFWWLLGSATLFPLLRGVPVDWSAPALTARFGSLVGHLLFGILLGVVYGVADRLWCLLFYESDPINRAPVGPAVESLRAARWGALASLGGGLLFGGLLWRTGQLSTVGALVGVREPAVGFVVHLGIASIIGMSYGQLFRYEAPDLGTGAAWGLVYGVVWWVVGPLTLLPTLLGRPLDWTPANIETALPLLFGHLVYGLLTGVAFSRLERRRRAWAAVNPRIAEHERDRQRRFGTSAPAAVLVAMILLPVLFLLL